MSDNYGDQQINDSFDDQNSQVAASSYGSDEQQQDIQRDQQLSDKSQQQGQQDADQLQSVQSQPQQQKYQVIQQQQIQYDKPNQIRITSPFMTKYQKARIIGVRAVQISKNSPLYLTADSNSLMNWDPLTIAEKELAEKKIPFIIRRYLPDGSYEDWKLKQLKTFD